MDHASATATGCFCAWSRDLYRDVWVCFSGGVVVDVDSGLPVVHSGECSWTSR